MIGAFFFFFFFFFFLKCVGLGWSQCDSLAKNGGP